MAVGRGDSGFLRQVQRADEGVAQLRQKMQRSAQKRHAPADGLAAGQARNGLVHHGLEDAGRQVLTGRALVDKRLDVRLGEHAAARRNGIDLVIARRQVVQARSVLSSAAIWSINDPVPPAHTPFMRSSTPPVK